MQPEPVAYVKSISSMQLRRLPKMVTEVEGWPLSNSPVGLESIAAADARAGINRRGIWRCILETKDG